MMPVYKLYRLFVSLLLLLACFVLSVDQQRDEETAQISAELLANALNYVTSHANMYPNAQETITLLYEKNNVQTLYQVAKSMSNDGDYLTAIPIYHALADSSSGHVPSMFALGFAYSKHDKPKAIHYFSKAGQEGPHAASLYNAGKLLLEENDLVTSMRYLLAAAQMDSNQQQIYVEAYNLQSQTILDTIILQLSVQEMMDLYPYANIHGHSTNGIWENARNHVSEYLKTHTTQQLQLARTNLSMLFNDEVSKLQSGLLNQLLIETMSLMNHDEL